MRKIKFRGQSIETDAIAYGYLVVYENHHYTHWLITPGLEPNVPVKPESVAQLIGLDKNGVEVYEGDELIKDTDETRFKAAMNHLYTVKYYRKVI